MAREKGILEGLVTPQLFETYKGKTVLVTGDSGFKGSWLAIWLRELGARVVGFSRPPKTPEDNFVVTGLATKIEHIDGDIRNFGSILEVVSEFQPEIIFHLAAQSLVLESCGDPLEAYSTNVMGTANVLEAIRKVGGVDAAIMVTTDKCYDNQELSSGYREGDRLGGKDPYSASKAASELVISAYQSMYFSEPNTCSIASARAGNVLGGGDWNDNRIISDCMRAFRENRPVEIRNPNSIRPWQHVLEALSGYLRLGALLTSEGKKYQSAWNFGPINSRETTVRELVQNLVAIYKQGEIIFNAPTSDHMETGILKLDASKAVEFLGWQPKMNLSTMIRFIAEEYDLNGMGISQVYAQRVAHISEYCSL